MGADLTADIERLTGREVIAFMSTNHIDPDVAGELFILKPQSAELGYAPATGSAPASSEDAAHA